MGCDNARIIGIENDAHESTPQLRLLGLPLPFHQGGRFAPEYLSPFDEGFLDAPHHWQTLRDRLSYHLFEPGKNARLGLFLLVCLSQP